MPGGRRRTEGRGRIAISRAVALASAQAELDADTPPALSIELLDLADEFVAVVHVLLDAFAPALGLGRMGSHRGLPRIGRKALILKKSGAIRPARGR